jgi:hypothetical protein
MILSSAVVDPDPLLALFVVSFYLYLAFLLFKS